MSLEPWLKNNKTLVIILLIVIALFAFSNKAGNGRQSLISDCHSIEPATIPAYSLLARSITFSGLSATITNDSTDYSLGINWGGNSSDKPNLRITTIDTGHTCDEAISLLKNETGSVISALNTDSYYGVLVHKFTFSLPLMEGATVTYSLNASVWCSQDNKFLLASLGANNGLVLNEYFKTFFTCKPGVCQSTPECGKATVNAPNDCGLFFKEHTINVTQTCTAFKCVPIASTQAACSDSTIWFQNYKWYVIGGACLLLVILIVLVVKKKK